MIEEDTPTIMQRKVKAAALAIAALMEMPSNKDSAKAAWPVAKKLLVRLEGMLSTRHRTTFHPDTLSREA